MLGSEPFRQAKPGSTQIQPIIVSSQNLNQTSFLRYKVSILEQGKPNIHLTQRTKGDGGNIYTYKQVFETKVWEIIIIFISKGLMCTRKIEKVKANYEMEWI